MAGCKQQRFWNFLGPFLEFCGAMFWEVASSKQQAATALSGRIRKHGTSADADAKAEEAPAGGPWTKALSIHFECLAFFCDGSGF